MTTAQDTIGKLLSEAQPRDAIHVAMASVVALERLKPGQHIALAGGSTDKACVHGTTVGIVDPFLKKPVNAGELFWMLLYPNTVTSLRHEWTHPAFSEVAATATATATATTRKEASEAWIRGFILRSGSPDYHTLIAEAVAERGGRWDTDDEYLHFSGSDAHGDIPDEFWRHVEVVTGKKITRRPKYFSCSC